VPILPTLWTPLGILIKEPALRTGNNHKSRALLCLVHVCFQSRLVSFILRMNVCYLRPDHYECFASLYTQPSTHLPIQTVYGLIYTRSLRPRKEVAQRHCRARCPNIVAHFQTSTWLPACLLAWLPAAIDLATYQSSRAAVTSKVTKLPSPTKIFFVLF